MSGHLGVKSGPLAPTSCKLSKQMLVLQHMNAHYKNLQNVKSSIDMSAPKTLSTSVKSRDRMRRQQGVSGRTPNSRPTSSRPSSRASYTGDHFSSNQAYADDPVVDQIVREALNDPSQDDDLRLQLGSARAPPRSPYAPKSSPAGGRRALYDSARSSLVARRPSSAKGSDREKAGEGPEPGGDVLDRHKERFTAARPFQPRLLRKDVPSKLSQFRYYNKPKPVRRANEPPPLPPNGETEAGWDGDAAHKERSVTTVDGDPDKVRWLVQQAESARLRQDLGQNSHQPLGDSAIAFNPETSTSFGRTQARDVGDFNMTDTMQRVQEEEEELKYLQFYSDVTDDVLNRGIFTNKVLNQVFQHHLERNKHGLRITKMREILQNIRTELGIPEDDRLDNSFGYAPGATGLSVRDGASGLSYRDGASGLSYRDGASGLSFHDGASGLSYRDGASGLSVRDGAFDQTDQDFRPSPAPRLDLQRRSSDLGVYEVEESDLAICQVRPSAVTNAEDSYEVTDLGREPVPSEPSEAPGWRATDAPMDVTPPRARRSFLTNDIEGEKVVEMEEEAAAVVAAQTPKKSEFDAEELLTTQDEADLEMMQETMRSAIERSVSQESTEGTDVTDASPEKHQYEKEHWMRKADLNDSNYSEATSVEPRSLSSTLQSESAFNPMATTLRPGVFDTMLQTTARDPHNRHGAGLPPLARTRMGKSVTFASQDEVLADSMRADSDAEGATLTEVSLASSSLELGSLRRSLPSDASESADGVEESTTAGGAAASTDYDDDFEDDDGF